MTEPERFPSVFCVGLTVQHTGTWFLAATLKELTAHSGCGWPPPATGDRGQLPGFKLQHLYGRGRKDATLGRVWREWIEGTDLPVVVTVRHPQLSMDTWHRRTGPDGVRGYDAGQHVDSLRRLVAMVHGHEPGLEAERVRAFRVDCRPDDRAAELHGLLAHVVGAPPHALGPLEGRVTDWAAAWPRYNHRARRVVAGEPSTPAPAVPAELVAALGYEPRPPAAPPG